MQFGFLAIQAVSDMRSLSGTGPRIGAGWLLLPVLPHRSQNIVLVRGFVAGWVSMLLFCTLQSTLLHQRLEGRGEGSMQHRLDLSTAKCMHVFIFSCFL